LAAASLERRRGGKRRPRANLEGRLGSRHGGALERIRGFHQSTRVIIGRSERLDGRLALGRTASGPTRESAGTAGASTSPQRRQTSVAHPIGERDDSRNLDGGHGPVVVEDASHAAARQNARRRDSQ